MTRLVALKPQKYGSFSVSRGEAFNVAEPQARVMVALGWAERAKDAAKVAQPAPLAPPVQLEQAAPAVEGDSKFPPRRRRGRPRKVAGEDGAEQSASSRTYLRSDMQAEDVAS